MLLCYPPQLQRARWACAVSFTVQYIFLSAIYVLPLSGSVPKNPTMLCLVGKCVFEPDFAMYGKNTLLFTGSCWVSLGMIIVSRGWKVFDLLTEKGIPPRTERWENTLLPIPHASQSFDHNGILLKINGNKKIFGTRFFFPIRGKNHMHNITKSIYFTHFPQRLQYRARCLK